MSCTLYSYLIGLLDHVTFSMNYWYPSFDWLVGSCDSRFALQDVEKFGVLRPYSWQGLTAVLKQDKILTLHSSLRPRSGSLHERRKSEGILPAALSPHS